MEASQESSSHRSTEVLSKLTSKISVPRQLPLILLFFNLIGLGGQALDGVESLLTFKSILNGSKKYRDKTIPIMQYVLELIGVVNSDDLESTKEELEACRKEFAYASVIVKVCMDLNSKEFKQLKENLGEDRLNASPDNFKSCADLFINLLHQGCLISQDDLALLTEQLTTINRKDIAAYVTHFIESGCYDPHLASRNRFQSPQQETNQELTNGAGERKLNTDEDSSARSLGDALPNLGTSEQQDAVAGVDDNDTEANLFGAAISTTGQQEGHHQFIVVSQPVTRPDNSRVYVLNGTPQRQPIDTCSDRGPEPTTGAQRSDHTSQSQPKVFTTPTSPTGSTAQVGRSPEVSTGRELIQSGSVTSPQQDTGGKTSTNDPEPLKVIADGDSIDSLDATVGDGKEEEEQNLLKKDSPHVHSPPKTFCKKNKKCCIGCTGTCIATVVFTVFVAGFCAMVGIGKQMYSEQSALIDNNTLNMTLFAVEGDTIVLGMVDTGVVSKVTVEETTEHGDSSHLSSVFLESYNSLNKRSTTISKDFVGFYSKIPWRTSGLIDHTYILGGGLINYKFCAAHPSQGTGDGFIYIFNSEKQYSDYSAQTPGTESFSATLKRELNIGTFNQSECRSIEFQIEDPGYFYVVVDTPGDLYYNYSYEIRDIYFDHMDYDPVCDVVYEGKACSHDLPTDDGLNYILAYVKPLVDFGSRTTHLRLMTSGVTETVQDQLRLSVILFSVGGTILLFLCFLFIAVCIIVYVCRQKKLKRRSLLS